MKRTYIVLIITMLVIGFATVATNLVINGIINFGFNQNDFDSNVVFTYAASHNGTAEIDETTEKSITFISEKLENVNQQSILSYDVANKSQQYDASVTISCNFEEGYKDFNDWLKIEQDLDPKFTLEAGKTITGHLTVTLIKAYNNGLNDEVNIKCELNASPTEREEKQEYIPKDHEYEEILLKGADPVLEATPVEEIALAAETNEKKLIPVKIDENGNVTRADTTKEWYNYEKKEWANAVILVNGVEDPEPEGPIKEEQIESYFVWIPKYRYKIFDMGHYNNLSDKLDETKQNKAIEIEFGIDDTKNDENECVAPSSGEDGNCKVGKWMTHPAFTSFDVNGFWVGKFETGYKQMDNFLQIEIWNKENAEKDLLDPTKVIIKPNVYSWRNITGINCFKTSYDYKRDLNSHLMKNTEWGAVAYLSQSVYGRCLENNSCVEVTLNQNPNYVTGYADNKYPNSQLASTTGNITGIYDMSGGAWERMASAMEGLTEDKVQPSTFSTLPYYDLYKYSTNNSDYSKRILGDATGEMGPFSKNNIPTSSYFKDYADFIYTDNPWFHRVGNGGGAGIFSFAGDGGQAFSGHGFRIVLSPKEG